MFHIRFCKTFLTPFWIQSSTCFLKLTFTRQSYGFSSYFRSTMRLTLLECSTPRAALIYFGLRQFIAALDSHHVPVLLLKSWIPKRLALLECGESLGALIYFGLRQFIAALEYSGLRHVSCRFRSAAILSQLRYILESVTSQYRFVRHWSPLTTSFHQSFLTAFSPHLNIPFRLFDRLMPRSPFFPVLRKPKNSPVFSE